MPRRLVPWLTVCAVLLAAAAPFLGLPAPVRAASQLTLEARPMLAGHARLGAWAAIAVTVRNDGPPVQGELRLAGQRAGSSTYSLEAHLPTTSEKRFVLYGQPSLFRTQVNVELVSRGRTIATTTARIALHDAGEPLVAVLAERPERLVADVGLAIDSATQAAAGAISLTPADLPPRVESWLAIDQLVWQDIDAGDLSGDQLDSLQGWISAGGRLIVVGGPNGAAAVEGFPAGLPPYRPAATIDAPSSDVAGLLGGARPAGTFAALAGTLERGSVLASSGNRVIAAEADYGQGSVVLVGVDPAQNGLAGTAAGRALWRRAIGGTPRAAAAGIPNNDPSYLLTALNRLPSADLPRVDQLFGLLAGYIVLVGPLNYLVLRRLDRREWAWLTIPALIVVFALGSYVLGRALKGDDVIVNQLSIVRGSAGTERGLAESYVGVFSPSRQRFDVRVGNAPLVSTIEAPEMGLRAQPLDVVSGETTRVRGYQVGYGALRGFRAQSAAPAPAIEASLKYVDGKLIGEVRNDSDQPLEGPALAFGGGVQVLGELGPGQSRRVELTAGGNRNFGMPLADRLFGPEPIPDFSSDGTSIDRVRFARRALIQQISTFDKLGGQGVLAPGIGGDVPVLLAWRSEGVLPVTLKDQKARNLGQTLYAITLPVAVEGSAVFGTDLVRPSIVEINAAEASDQGTGFALGRGSLTVEYRPLAFRGRLGVSELRLGVSQGEGFGPDSAAPERTIQPLPAAQQPSQDDPVGSEDTVEPIPAAPDIGQAPAVQLFDRLSGRWLEFPHLELGRMYRIASPERYVDDSGAFLVRFVVRDPQSLFFRLAVRLEGTIR